MFEKSVIKYEQIKMSKQTVELKILYINFIFKLVSTTSS